VAERQTEIEGQRDMYRGRETDRVRDAERRTERRSDTGAERHR
jgi:hypothetical protein